MSADYSGYAVIGVVMPIRDSDFEYKKESSKGCDHEVPEDAEFCSKCGAPKKSVEVMEVDQYDFEHIVKKSQLSCVSTTDRRDFVIGICPPKTDGNYGPSTTCCEIPDSYVIASELIKIKDAILKHPRLSKTNLVNSFQDAINKGIKLHCVCCCSY